jgi:hypothetical protein
MIVRQKRENICKPRRTESSFESVALLRVLYSQFSRCPSRRFSTIAYPDVSNAVARSRELARHLFDPEAGLALLQGWLLHRNRALFSRQKMIAS